MSSPEISRKRKSATLANLLPRILVSTVAILLAGLVVVLTASRSDAIRSQAASVLERLQASKNESEPDESSEANVSTVSTMVVEKSDDSSTTRTYSGVFMATQSSDLGFKRTGQLVELKVDQGQRAKKGEVLAVLDTATILAERAVLAATRRSAQAKLDELISGPRVEAISAAKAKLQEFAALRDQARNVAERKQRLIGGNATSRQSLEKANYDLDASENRYQSQLEVVRELEAGTRSEQLESQQAVIEQLDAQIEAVEIQLEESELVAPFDAVVSQRFVDTGVIVAPQVRILRLIEDESPEAWIGLPIDVAHEINGDENVTLISGGRRFPAKFKTLLPELDASTRTQTVIFETISDASSRPTIGAIAQLEWAHQSENDGFWIPLDSIARGNRGLWSIYVVEQMADQANRFVVRLRDVEFLQVDTDRVLVRGILNEGDRIVSAGLQRLTPGQMVRLQSMEESPANASVSSPTRSSPASIETSLAEPVAEPVKTSTNLQSDT